VTSVLFTKNYFDTGLCLVTERNPFSHSVVVGLWFPLGSRFENKGEFGAYHFIEHLVFKSPNALKLVRQIESAGGDVNAFTAHEHTCFHVTCLKQDIRLALKFLACVRSKLDVTQQEFEKEKAVILQEIRNHHDDIEDEVHRFFMSKVLRGSPLAHPISGDISDIMGLNLEQLKKIHKTRYRRNKAVISVTGNFELKSLIELVEKEFKCEHLYSGGKKGSQRSKSTLGVSMYYQELAKSPKIQSSYFKPGVYVKERKTQQLYFTLSFSLDSVYSDERFSASLLSSWFGQGMTSYLFRKLREDLGLVYFVHSHVSTFLDQGLFLIEASCEPQKMPEVIEIICFEVKMLQSKVFSHAFLNTQKKLLRGQVLLGAEDLENRMQSIALNELIFQQYRNPHDYLRKFESVNSHTIRKFVLDKLRFDQSAIVLYGHRAKEFKTFIEKLLVSMR